jgi:hypothetical protein|tara:strand:+ start:1279 stop:1578 length:300 start_codon:yes stop_codon:yes gene_type:complete
MLLTLAVTSITLNLIFCYSAYVTTRKIESYEDIVQYYEAQLVKFYEDASKILATSRRLDRQEMFEKDDEVGLLFEQLIDTIGGLRTLIYATEETEEGEG